MSFVRLGILPIYTAQIRGNHSSPVRAMPPDVQGADDIGS
jgi:hypothetical protein